MINGVVRIFPVLSQSRGGVKLVLSIVLCITDVFVVLLLLEIVHTPSRVFAH